MPGKFLSKRCLMSFVDATPVPWWQSLKITRFLNKSLFVMQDQIQLVLNNQEVLIMEAIFKKVCREMDCLQSL